MKKVHLKEQSLFLLVVALLSTACPVSAKNVTVDDLMNLRSLVDVEISPDGNRVAYVVSAPSFETDAHEATLYEIPVSGGTPLRLTYGTRIFNRPIPAPRLRWLPNGKFLSFVGYVNNLPQVMEMSIAGGEAWAITSAKDGVTDYEWSPDGNRIAFLTTDPVPSEEDQRKTDKTYVISVGHNKPGSRLWVQDLAKDSLKVVTSVGKTIVDFHWSPDGRQLIYSASDVNDFSSIYHTRIFAVAPAGGDARAIVDRPGVNRAPQFSPDGRWIAFISSDGYSGMVSAEGLFLVSSDTRPGAIRNLTATQQPWIGEFEWAPDSRSIFYTTSEQTNGRGAKMFEQPVSRVYLDDDRIDTVTPGRVVNSSLSLSHDAATLAYKSIESRTMGDVYVMSTKNGRAIRLTEINPQLHDLELGDLEPVHWKSFDGQEIWGLLLIPPGYKPGKPIPLVVYCHGGPIGGFSYGIFPQFTEIPGQVDPYPSEAMASAGMAIFFPMPRGGSGYGVSGFRATLNAWGKVDYKDIMTGVDSLIARGIADPNRMGVMGASYGGYMTEWIVTQTGRFKAASAGAGTSDLTQEYYLSDMGDFMVEYFGYPWADGALAARSPITYVTNVTTPLLIQHGEDDHRVPLSEAWEFYRALNALHKTVEFDIYPRGGHVNFEPKLEREYMRRNLEWFTRWLEPDSRSGG